MEMNAIGIKLHGFEPLPEMKRGDTLIVIPSETPEPGDIILAYRNSEDPPTLFHYEKGRDLDEFLCHYVVSGFFRKYLRRSLN